MEVKKMKVSPEAVVLLLLGSVLLDEERWLNLLCGLTKEGSNENASVG
jgi:hypothetical protein